MQVCCEPVLTPGWLVTKIRPPDFCLTMIVKAICPLKPGRLEFAPADDAAVCGTLHYGEDSEQSLYYESDLAPYKPRADVLLVGSAQAHSDRPVEQLRVGLRVGDQVAKMIDVYGDRALDNTTAKPINPRPFVRVPLRYELAYGGPGDKRNPVGTGRGGDSAPPNLEHLTEDGGRTGPAGFGPLAGSWEPRRGMVGSYSEDWVRQRWPWLPADFDWNYFNAAPLDQQFDGYLRGDEEIELRSLHATHPALHCRLPGARVRAFLHERRDGGQAALPDGGTSLLFREIPLHLDTLWIDTDAEQVVLVWRGIANVRSFKIDEIENMMIVSERLGEPLPKEAYFGALLQWLENDGEPEDKEWAEIQKRVEEAERQADQDLQEAQQLADAEKAEKIAAGADPASLEPQPPATTQAELKMARASLVALLADWQANGVDEARIAELSAKIAEIDRILEALGPEPPTTREGFAAAVGRGDSLAEQRFSNLDLSGLDLSGADLAKTILLNVNLAGANLTKANLSGALLERVNLSDANLSDAVFDDAWLADAQLEGAKLTGLSVANTTMNRLELPGADFRGVKGAGADLSNSNLAGCLFAEAEFPGADFSGCQLEEADFSNAILDDADLEGCKARGIVLAGVEASGLRAGSGADFSGARCRKLVAKGSGWDESVLDGADFTGAVLADAVFTGASMQKTIFHRAELTGVEMSDTCLEDAVFTSANLLRASFDRANLKRADFQASNMYEAGFWDAVTENANFGGANLTNTMLS